MWVQSLGGKVPLETGMATQSGILAYMDRISWTEEPAGLQSTGSQRVGPLAHNLSSTSPHGSPFLSPALI